MSFTVLPTPQECQLGPESVMIGQQSPVEADDDVPSDLVELVSAMLPCGAGSTPVCLATKADAGPEGYDLAVADEGIRVTASERAGFVHAIERLRQITRAGRVPVGRIHDSPSLPLRAFQVNLCSLRHLELHDAMSVLDAMARWKLNAALFEYGDRYPYAKHSAICADDALTREELDILLAHAGALGIEPIPLHQCLGHVEFILRKDEYAHIREEDEKRDQWCPLNPASFDLFRELVDDVAATHEGLRYFHIGGDEARRLGDCPKCAEVAAKHGASRLYIDFVARAVEHVKSHGLTPIIWDDMLCRHSEVIDELPRDVVIMYWEYWTTHSPSAIFVARPDGKGVVVDQRWKSEWADELDPVERRMIDHFARPIDFERDLSPEFLSRFSPYLGDQFPKRVRAFPYLEYYQDLGFPVMVAPAGGSNQSTWRQLPDFPRYADNIATFCQRAHEAAALGVVTTSWYDFPVDAVMPAIMYTGQASWNVATSRG